MKLNSLSNGQVMEANPFMENVSLEPLLLQAGSKTDEDVLVTVTYFGVSLGNAYISQATGKEIWEWVE